MNSQQPIAELKADDLPLKGIRVLDLGRVMAGPSGAQLLGDYGADVLRIEDMEGDETRRWPPVAHGEGCNYQSVNRNKRGMVLNLKTPAAREVLSELVKMSDVVLHSYLPDVAKRLGLDDETLRILNPCIIVCGVSGYGASGPMALKSGYDLMLQAYTGVMELTGDPDGPPQRAGCSLLDLTTGILAFSGVLLALLAKARGRPAIPSVQVSLFETALTLLSYHLTNYANGDFQPRRAGSGVGHLSPYAAFMCLDGYVLAGATNDEVWRRMATVLGHAEWATDVRFATNAERVTNRKDLGALLEGVFAQHPRQHWIDAFEAVKVPIAPVRTIVDLFDDPQTKATSMLERHNWPGRPPMTLVGAPIKIAGAAAPVRHLPPLHGQHTTEILRELLSISDSDIAKLRESKSIPY
jgi:crotonobetainyl-CoA:carnitine CoA-transferase CaiB-like acyl-CoA transferase